MNDRASAHLIPITVGVTAHRAIREEDRAALSVSVTEQLRELKERCPNSPIRLLTSLAEGGDQLCAEAAQALSIPLIVALPFPLDEFEKDFTPLGLERLHTFCRAAELVFVAPPTEAIPEGGVSRDYLYRQAGIYVAAHSHLVLALWDGGPGTAAACGTSEAVGFSLLGEYDPAEGTALRSGSNTAVIHVFTPRGSRTEEAAGTVRLLGNRAALLETLERTDEFNRLASAIAPSAASRLPEPPEENSPLARAEQTGIAAGKLSVQNARLLHRILALLAACSTIVTLAFLLYDEAETIWMILVCGIFLLTARILVRSGTKSACHRRYLEYRALAESLRVHVFLRYAGSLTDAAQLLTWTQQTEAVWIMAALCSLSVGPQPSEKHDILDCWINDQKRYHLSAGTKSRRNLAVSERIVRICLILSVFLYISALLFELFCGGLSISPLLKVSNPELWRTWLKILLGLLSASTIFIGNYYGRLSLARICDDHKKMAAFYERMGLQFARSGQEEQLLTLLAREELIESGNWYSYQRDNTLDFSL